MTKRGTYKNCEKCNKLFYEYPYEKDKRRFCSQDCSNKFTASQQSELKRKRSIENTSHIGRKWRYTWAYEDWRSKVFKRDDFQCVFCGSEKALIAHHLKPYEEFPELRIDIDNGITLCRPCHNRLDDGIKSSQY